MGRPLYCAVGDFLKPISFLRLAEEMVLAVFALLGYHVLPKNIASLRVFQVTGSWYHFIGEISSLGRSNLSCDASYVTFWGGKTGMRIQCGSQVVFPPILVMTIIGGTRY